MDAFKQGLLESEAGQDSADEAVGFGLLIKDDLVSEAWSVRRAGELTHPFLGLVDLFAIARDPRPGVDPRVAAPDAGPAQRPILAVDRSSTDIEASVLVAIFGVDARERFERVRVGSGRDGAAPRTRERTQFGRVLERADSAAADTLHDRLHPGALARPSAPADVSAEVNFWCDSRRQRVRSQALEVAVSREIARSRS